MGDVIVLATRRHSAASTVSRKSSAETRPRLTRLKQAIKSQDGRHLPRRMRLIVLRSQDNPDDLRTSEAISSSSIPRAVMNSESCMGANVHQVHMPVKPACAWSGMELDAPSVHDMHMSGVTRRKFKESQPAGTPYQASHMRVWRELRKKTLEEMAEKCGKTYTQLSKIERGIQPYSQQILETYARELNCTVIDLLSRQPGEAEHVLSAWSRADERGRSTMTALAQFEGK